jgi:hypothetical protein
MKLLVASAALALCAVPAFTPAPVQAAVVLDAAGDFLPSFVGPNDPGLDVTSFSVNFNSAASEFLLGAAFAGAINPTGGGLYVIGANTGTGPNAPFGSIGAPNVRFNQVVLVRADGTGLVSGPTGGPLASGAITIAGNLFTVRVPLSALPSTGFAPGQYLWNLWPRNGLGNNNQISDFAPNDGGLAAVAVPEPTSWIMMIAGFLAVGGALRAKKGRRMLAS